MAKTAVKPAKTTTGAAADRTAAGLVEKSKRGQGTLTYTPAKSAPPKRKGAS
jgi:hypothetical protein